MHCIGNAARLPLSIGLHISILRIAAFVTAFVLFAAPAATRAEFSIMTGQPSEAERARCETAPAEPVRKSCLAVYSVPRLKLPTAAEETTSSSGRMGIYKPSGNGPFPALVLLHTCGAAFDNMAHWAAIAVKAGYVAFIVDSWGQRGLGDGICGPTTAFRGNTTLLRVRDALDALSHLANFPFVDRNRVAVLGASQGARAVYLLASRAVSRRFSADGTRFAAHVALYGECYNRVLKHVNIVDDIDRPILALLGDSDEDGDASECVPRFEKAKAAGAPIRWHVFAHTGHNWDFERFARPVYRPYPAAKSGKVLYEYSRDATRATVL